MSPQLLLVVAAIAVGVAWMAVTALQRECRCATCGGALDEVASVRTNPRVGGYDVVCCRRCGSAHTRVHGRRSSRGYCPACTQRTLELSCTLTHSPPPIVEVHEQCDVCSHESSQTLTGGAATDAPKRGQVVEFPGGDSQP